MTTSVEKAQLFFSKDLDTKEYPEFFSQETKEDAEDTDGLVTWVGATTEIPEAWQTQYAESFADLNNLLGIANNYYQSKVKPEQRYEFAVWDLVYSKLPNFGATKSEDKTFEQEIIGIEIAVSFLNMLLEIAVLPTAAAATFGTFLRGLGESIRIGVETSKKSFRTVWNNMTFEFIDKVGFVPKLKLYYIAFDLENSSFTSGCASYQKFNIKFEYKYRSQLFKYEALAPKSEARKLFDEFIDKQIKKDIDDADNFFNDSFETAPGTHGAEEVAKFRYTNEQREKYVQLVKEALRKKYNKKN